MKSDTEKLNILILFDANSIHVNTVTEHLKSFATYSQHQVYYAHATSYQNCRLNLAVFDVIYIHYSIRINMSNTAHALSTSYFRAIRAFNGFKVLFIQDEYETTDVAKKNILELGINALFTTVSSKYVNKVYPSEQFQHIDFIPTLTGYVPENSLSSFQKPLGERQIFIGYRGRELPFWYGNLGREKLLIGKQMQEICQGRKLKCDIEWAEEKRIYGDAWYEFLGNCRATLGTESGANIFDFSGQLSSTIKKELAKNPQLSYDTIFDKYLRAHENYVVMNQISPKIFEAIALHTALVLFEGSYSNVIQPDIHYIPLKKDFSNVDEVLKKIADDDYILQLTERAYTDIVASGKYSYDHFVKECDQYLNQKKITRQNLKFVATDFVALAPSKDKISNYKIYHSFVTNELLTTSDFKNVMQPNRNKNLQWIYLPLVAAVDRIVASGLIELFKKINTLLPGKPLAKIYYKLRQRLKI